MASFLRSRRFAPLFVTQFLGALNDNLLKNALVVLIAYRLAAESGIAAGILVAAAAGVFILPFCLFSALAGQMADKYDRARLARLVKLAEIAIFVVAFFGFLWSSLAALFAALFLLGVHSAFFGPIKYAVLPQYLTPGELLDGNAWIGAGTFLAILLGTITGGLMVTQAAGPQGVAVLGIVLAFVGYRASCRMPPAPPMAGEGLRLCWHVFSATGESLADVWRIRVLRLPVLAISWFWCVGATYLAQIPVFGQQVLHADERVVTLMLTLFSLGVGLGALLVRRVKALRHAAGGLALNWACASAMALAFAGLALVGAVAMLPPPDAEAPLYDLAAFLAMPGALALMAALLALAISGGAYVVPLYTALQRLAPADALARTIGGLNIFNAFAMVLSALMTMAVMATGGGVRSVFVVVALGGFAVAGLLRRARLEEKRKS